MGKPAEALRAYERARDVIQKSASINPAVTDFQRILAKNQAMIGEALSRGRKPAEALEAYQRGQEILQRLADANPAVTDFQLDLGWTLNHMSILLEYTGQTAEALRTRERARDIRQKLADANPGVTDFQRDLARSHNGIGEFLRRWGKPAEALQAYDKARRIQQKLADANPAVTEFQRDLQQTITNQGLLYGRVGDFPKAFEALDGSVATCQQLMADHPTDAVIIDLLGESHVYRGFARAHAGRLAEAASDLRRGVELYDRNTAPSLETRFERAWALALLAGLGADANSGVSAAEAARFADQAVAGLRDAVQAGWAQRQELDKADFDALRKREDFQKLLKDLETKPDAKGP
jgi:tetratricopeptide (TPR) repeat protein